MAMTEIGIYLPLSQIIKLFLGHIVRKPPADDPAFPRRCLTVLWALVYRPGPCLLGRHPCDPMGQRQLRLCISAGMIPEERLKDAAGPSTQVYLWNWSSTWQFGGDAIKDFFRLKHICSFIQDINNKLALAAYMLSLHPDNDLHLSHLSVLGIKHNTWNMVLLQVVW